MKNIALVGFMGTGKTTVAQILAEKLNLDYVDLDAVIEVREQMEIANIFSQKGEEYFRKVEKKVVTDISGQTNKVIACGGGVVLDEENMQNLKASGIVICLEASPEVILARTKDYPHRPLLNVKDKEGRIRELLEKRAVFYARADCSIDTSHCTQAEVVEKVLQELKD